MKFSIMDVTGHSEEAYSESELAAGARRFKELLRGGHTAAVRKPGASEYEVSRKFPQDPEAEVLFVPRLKGG